MTTNGELLSYIVSMFIVIGIVVILMILENELIKNRKRLSIYKEDALLFLVNRSFNNEIEMDHIYELVTKLTNEQDMSDRFINSLYEVTTKELNYLFKIHLGLTHKNQICIENQAKAYHDIIRTLNKHCAKENHPILKYMYWSRFIMLLDQYNWDMLSLSKEFNNIIEL